MLLFRGLLSIIPALFWTAPAGAAAVEADGTGPPVGQLPASIRLAQWRGGNGLWSAPTNWVPLGTPGLSLVPYHVYIDGATALNSNVLLDVDAGVARLTISAGDALTIQEGRTLDAEAVFQQVIVTNAGTLRLQGGAAPSMLRISDGSICELNGGGTLSLDHELHAAVTAEGEGSILINADQLIRGEGRLGDGTITVENRSVILADQPFRRLSIHPGPGGAENSGLIMAINGGVVSIESTTVDNHDGLIRAEDDSFVDLSDVVLTSGRLETAPGGYIRMMDEPVEWRELDVNGQMILGPTQLHLAGAISNDGLIDVVGDLALGGGYDATSEIILSGDEPVTLGGEGTLRLFSCRLRSAAAPATLINAADHSITGEGPIGDGALSIENNGLFDANGQVAMLFNLGSSRRLINRGELRATGLGGMVIATGQLRNDGVVQVQPASRLLMMPGVVCENCTGGILLDGTWRVIAGDCPTTISFTGSTIAMNLADVTLSGPGASIPKLNGLGSNGGVLRLLDGQIFTAGSTFSNAGSVELGPGSLLQAGGQFTQAPVGRLTIDVAMNSSGEVTAGRINAGASAFLAGTLEVVVADDVPLNGATLHIIDVPVINGQFATILGPSGMVVTYDAGGVYIVLPNA